MPSIRNVSPMPRLVTPGMSIFRASRICRLAHEDGREDEDEDRDRDDRVVGELPAVVLGDPPAADEPRRSPRREHPREDALGLPDPRGGKTSGSIAKPSGNIAMPTPWTARTPIRT